MALRDLLPVMILTVAGAMLAGAQTMAAPQSGQMAVAFPPFISETAAWEVVREAGGYVVAPTRLPNVVVAYAPDPDFQDRARRLGALLFLSAKGLCAPQLSSEAS